MVDENDHSACVDAWLERVAKDLPAGRLLRVFEQGFTAVWRRAHRTLGDVTLAAIGERVLHNAAENFPFLSSLEIGRAGLRFEGLEEHARTEHPEHLASGLRFVLVEFLTVLGSLTAEILTPVLHSELMRAAPDERGPETESRGEPQTSGGEGARS